MVMMVAMMLPSLIPKLSRSAADDLTLFTGYFLVWTALGAAVYPLGVIAATAAMRWPALARAVPVATAMALMLAGCVQLTAWKARKLGRCREASACGPGPWRHGLRLGVNCILCCASFMTILLVTGVMNLTAMAIVAAAITIERFVPSPERAARAIGVIVIAAGILTLSTGR
jgi:predicted metal-binding membrane protein